MAVAGEKKRQSAGNPGKKEGTTDLERGEQRHRVQLDFSSEAHERLQRLREKAEARTNAELVRNSLRLYEWLLDEKARGFRLALVRDDDDVVREVELLF